MPTLYCPSCGYNLTGLRDNRCPECGEGFDPEELRHNAQTGPLASIWPMLSILLAPAMLFVGILAWVGIDSLVRGVGPAFATVGMLLVALTALATSVYAGFVEARRSLNMPPRSKATIGCILRAMLFTMIFLVAQLCLMFVALLAGCAVVAAVS